MTSVCVANNVPYNDKFYLFPGRLLDGQPQVCSSSPSEPFVLIRTALCCAVLVRAVLCCAAPVLCGCHSLEFVVVAAALLSKRGIPAERSDDPGRTVGKKRPQPTGSAAAKIGCADLASSHAGSPHTVTVVPPIRSLCWPAFSGSSLALPFG